MSFLLFILNSILLGVGLAMDAFSVSLANGLQEPEMSRRRQALMAGIYAGFQFAMPVIGFILTQAVVGVFRQLQVYIPWISLFLLSAIGGKMIYEGIKGEAEMEAGTKLGLMVLIFQGIATSIDALSVGLTFSSYSFSMVLLASVIIAIVTFFICLAGLRIGRFFGVRISGRAQIFGGSILIAIGLEIFLRGIFFG